eukprot:247683-Alexandrium_andersonii.AAC.1
MPGRGSLPRAGWLPASTSTRCLWPRLLAVGLPRGCPGPRPGLPGSALSGPAPVVALPPGTLPGSPRS